MESVHKLQAFLRAVAVPGRDTRRVGPFEAYLDLADELKYLNYAIPDDNADPSGTEIDALRAAFRERERLPRLEWIAEAAPLVAGALRAAGMREELATPLMACTPAELRVPDIEVEITQVSPADALAVRNLQRVAFGEPPASELAEAPKRVVCARVDGELCSAAAWTQVVDGVSEVAGVATAEPFRGRGLAGALSAAAARRAFDEGAAMCVLSPGDETAQRVYERAGFRRVATVLHWSDQP